MTAKEREQAADIADDTAGRLKMTTKERGRMLQRLWILPAAAAAYLAAVKPRSGRRADKMRGVFYAHRGLHDRAAGRPENTMGAFRAAVEAGYGIELDVRLTKDEKLVVFHDKNLKRLCGREENVDDLTCKELRECRVAGTQERIPEFTDVLRLVDGKVPLLVELKCERRDWLVSERTDALLQNYRGEYVIESFHPLVLLWYRLHRPEVCRGQLSMHFQRQEGRYHPLWIMATHLLFNFLGRPDFIAYDIRNPGTFSRMVCRRLFGCHCAAWTVRSQKQLEQCRASYDSFIFEGFRPENK